MRAGGSGSRGTRRLQSAPVRCRPGAVRLIPEVMGPGLFGEGAEQFPVDHGCAASHSTVS